MSLPYLIRRFAGITWLILVLAAVPRACLAQSPEAIFDSAGACYERGEYTPAIDLYTQLVQQGFDDLRVWYNLGNAEFKAGHVGRSIRAYLRAQRLAPRDPDIEANLQFVQLYAADKLEKPGRLFILGWGDSLSGHFTLSEWLAAAGILFLCLIVLTALKIWFGHLGRAAWYWLGLGFFLWLLTMGGAARHYRDLYLRGRGVIVVAETDVRGGPGDDYTLQFTGHDGLLFTIDRPESNWYLVTFANGMKGWILAEAVESI